MDLCLNQVFYTQVGTTVPQTMKVLPSVKKGHQKVAIGDSTGVVTIFEMKKGDTHNVFKGLPGPGITRLELGGSDAGSRDKVFVSSEAMIRGFSRKGKQFLSFDTTLTESVHGMCVEGSNLFVCGSYVYNHYVDCRDTNYYLSSDKINDILCLPPKPDLPLCPVLACQDNTLRALKDSELLYELEVAGPPMCIALNKSDGGEDGQEVLYGTQNGKMGLVKLTPTEPNYRWDMLNERKYGGISCISTWDITGDGVADIIVGRDDGVVEVYGFEDSDEPRLQFTHSLNESVTSVCGGVVGSSEHDEVIVATYSGCVLGLTKEQVAKQTLSQEVQTKLASLKEEVSSLEGKVHEAKERYQETVFSARETTQTLSALPQFPINDKFTLNQDEAWYTLAIEIQAPIETVMLQSDVPLDLQEVDTSSAVVSYTPPDTDNDNYLLATFRCHDTNRLEVKVRSIEGQYGTLHAYIVPLMEPKSCRVRQYQIKPLSLHQRTHSFDSTRPCNVLKLTGPFSLGEVHSWIRIILPNIPDQPANVPDQSTSDSTNTLHFKSTFIDTELEVVYRRGEAVFRSDNISTISVLKEVLSKETSSRKVLVKITHELDEDSISHVLGIIYPRLESQLMLAKNVQLIEALQEVKIHEEDTSFLSPQCQYILDNAQQMTKDLKQQPSLIERLYALITDLFMDHASFKGQNVKNKVPELLELLDNCDLESLLEFFHSSK
ncbi:Bardet-Biedl syndrome 7 protein homolog [Halichondria panicea]|uniref:Bardet-Biedl syndrome 7 protein homolog n=1 Tax=Halichondria panicea TaxID=6063 RepID=UPI00312B7EB3